MRKKKVILIAIGISLTTIVIFICGQIYAKYNTKITGEGLAPIATWNFQVNDQKEEVQAINLASTSNNETLLNNKIAPGTSGSFDIIVDGSNSDVEINYEISFTEENNKPQNLKFIYDNVEYNSIIELEDKLSGKIEADNQTKIKTFNIQWKWNYETGSTAEEIAHNDLIDTQDMQLIQNYTFKICITGKQAEPVV